MRISIGGLVLFVVFVLAGCGGGGGDDTQSANPTFPVEGRVLNSVVVGSTVEVYGADDGPILGTATSDVNGRFSAQVSQPGPYRLRAHGGKLGGVDYTGTLEAACSGGPSCLVTPYANVLLRLVDEHGFNPDDAASHIAGISGLDEDPFVPGTSTDAFDLDAAREAISGGDGLSTWVTSMVAWATGETIETPPGITKPDPAPEPDPETYAVSATAGAGGGISPASQVVNHGDTAEFEVTPEAGYSVASVSGCGGSLDGSTYTTGTITGACTVEASFLVDAYTVSATAGAGGGISPASQVVNHGDTAEFEVTPEAGYSVASVSGCGGSLDGSTYTTGAITGACTVSASFNINVRPPDTVSAEAGDRQITMNWSPVPGADSFNLYYASEPGITRANYDTLADGTRVTGVASGHTVTGLSNGTEYYLFITTVQDELESPASDTVTASPTASPWLKSAHRGSLKVEVKGPQKAKVHWDVRPGVRYNLLVTDDPDTDPENYAVFGGRLEIDVSPPFTIDGLSAYHPMYLSLEADGEITSWTSFVTGVWGTESVQVNAQVVSEGMRVVGGSFTSVDIVTGAGVVLPAARSGAQHALGFPDVVGRVYTVAPDGAGGWYLGGTFTHVDGEERSNLAHVDGQGRLTSWNPGANRGVQALAMDAGVVYAGGAFTSVGDDTVMTRRNYLAAFDAAGNLLPWNPGASGTVYALTVDRGVVYAGGHFRTAGGGRNAEERLRLAAFDTEGNLLSWNPGASDRVRVLTVDSGVIYAGGQFTSAGGGTGTTERNHLAAFDTAGDLLSWNPGANGTVRGLAVDSGVVYAGGQFTSAGGGTGTTERFGVAAFDTAGNLLPWNPGASRTVYALTVDSGVVYAGGDFRTAGGGTGTTERLRLAAFDRDGNLLSWDPGAGLGWVNALAAYDGAVFAGGNFIAAGGGIGKTERLGLAAFDMAGNLLPWNEGVIGGGVTALAMDRGTIYAGGHFHGRLAAFDKVGNRLGWSPRVTGAPGDSVSALAVKSGTIYVGGRFSSADGGAGWTDRAGLAAFDTAGNLLPWNPGARGGGVRVLTVDSGVIYAGGEFSYAGGGAGTTERDRLAAFDTAGDLLPWNPGASGNVYALTVDNGVVYVGGQFSRAGGGTGTTERDRLAAFDTAGNLLPWNPRANNPGFAAGGLVYALTVESGVVYAGGTFTHVGGGLAERRGLAAFDTAGNLLPWNPGMHGFVKAMTVGNGVVYVGGQFSRAGGGDWGKRSRRDLAAFDRDGEILDQ